MRRHPTLGEPLVQWEDHRVIPRRAKVLATVLAMARRTEPERRYASAAQLAEDLGRVERGLPVDARPDSIVTSDPAEAQRFFDHTVTAGHEGVMVKDLTAPYEAGRRGSGHARAGDGATGLGRGS